MFSEFVTQLVVSAGPWLVVGMGICSLLIVVVGDWRFSLLSFGLQSVFLALLGMRLLPFEMAVLRMLVGGLVAVLWFISARLVRWGERQEPARWWLLRRGRGERWPLLSAGPLMRWLAAGLAGAVFFRLQGRLSLPGLPGDLGLACTWLWLMGFLALAISDEPLRAGMGLITISWGFQLFYSALDSSPISIGVLSALDLLLALALAYLMVARGIAGRPRMARLLGVQAPGGDALGGER